MWWLVYIVAIPLVIYGIYAEKKKIVMGEGFFWLLSSTGLGMLIVTVILIETGKI
jgi:hypothetical protein